MVDLVATTVVFAVLLGLLSLQTRGFLPQLRGLVWLAFLERIVCTGVQLVFGLDSRGYADVGAQLSTYLDRSLSTAAPELLAMLFQRPSRFDALIATSGSNSGSMYAISAWLTFVFRSKDFAVPLLVAGLALFGALAIFRSFHEAYPRVNPRRLFAWTVLFPSLAFWTSALLKEAFCMMGIGCILAAWRHSRGSRWLPAAACAGLGLTLILLFRAPALPPLVMGLGCFFVFERMRRVRGANAALFGPIYVGLALAGIAAGVVLTAVAAPSLAPSNIGESVARQHGAWAVTTGGSNLAEANDTPKSPASLLLNLPLGLLNALFRPQLFDVNNGLVLISALEMTYVTFTIVRVFRQRGAKTFQHLWRSPFLMMCAVVVVVGCSFVGVVTLNLGSLARYRVPFFPFYGALLAVLSERLAPVRTREPAEARLTSAQAVPRRA